MYGCFAVAMEVADPRNQTKPATSMQRVITTRQNGKQFLAQIRTGMHLVPSYDATSNLDERHAAIRSIETHFGQDAVKTLQQVTNLFALDPDVAEDIRSFQLDPKRKRAYTYWTFISLS